MRTAVCTIVAKNYLPFARVLMNSIREHAPDAIRIVVLVDTVDGYFDPQSELFDVILSRDLPIAHSRWFHFKYSILELSTAVKPWVLDYLIEQYRLDAIVYLDPDIKVYAPFGHLFDRLRGHTMMLTPHLTNDYSDQQRPSELDIMRSGAYNLGFIAVNACHEAARFLKWWQGKLYDHCLVDLPRGLFVDQRWMDLTPGMFEGVVINREPGYNVAYWNLPHRQVRKTASGFEVNGGPLYFFHFSGFDPLNPERFSKHQNRYRLSDLSDAADLVREYRSDVLAAGYAECRNWPYAYGRFENGMPIPDMGRQIHTESDTIASDIEDPFSDEGFDAFVRIWNEPVLGPDRDRKGVTRLAYRIYRTRVDVQAAMPDILGGDYARFIEWMLSSGKDEHLLGNIFLTPVWEAARAAVRSAPAHTEAGPSEFSSLQNGTPRWLTLEPAITQTPADSTSTGGFRLTRLARAIYESRPDIQQYMPDPCGADGPKFLLWLLTYGRKEYTLADEYVAPLVKQWEELLRTLPILEAMRYRVLLLGVQNALRVRSIASRIATRARHFRARSETARFPNSNNKDREIAPEFGLTVVGYLRAEMGVGESARSAVKAAQSAHVPVAVKTVSTGGHYRESHAIIGSSEHASQYAFNIFHVNADQSSGIASRLGPRFFDAHYNIGYWAWELESFPPLWHPEFGRYREIWTPSSFCQEAISRVSPIPVIRMPHCIAPEYPSPVTDDDIGVAPGTFVFLCAFDMHSVFARKNPLAAIEAFRAAFGGDDRCCLIVKINNAHAYSRNVDLLREAAAGINVKIIDRIYSRESMLGLIRRSDCFVSLHRSEGFGLLIAEAMYFSKPVIVTSYSGNMDFTTADNSLLVDYTLKQVGPGCAPYDPNSRWADPDVECAARRMRTAFESSALRDRIGVAAHTSVSESLSPAAIGRRIRERLECIWSSVLSRSCSIPADASSVVISGERGVSHATITGEPFLRRDQ